MPPCSTMAPSDTTRSDLACRTVEAVRDDDRGTTFQRTVEGPLTAAPLTVQMRGGLVQDHHPRPFSSNRASAIRCFSPREPVPAIADHSVETFGQSPNQVLD